MMGSTTALHSLTRPTRIAGVAAVLLTVGLGASACGGDDGGSDSPMSAKELCSALDDIDDDATIGDAVDKFDDVELSDEIPSDAAQGFDALINLFKTLPQDTSGEDFDNGNVDVDPSDLDQDLVKKSQAFLTWSDSNCD